MLNQRYEELDSLRGLAALSVFFGHMYLLFNETFVSKLLFEYGVFRFAIAGGEAVTLFFVLSGFVLSLPFYINKPFSYGTYAIRRICRVYIPYITVIAIAFIARESFYSGKINGLTNWFNVNWSSPLNFNSLMDHVLFLGTFTSNLDNVVWSLIHEMRISLIFPIIMFIILRTNLKQGIGLSLLLSTVSIIYFVILNTTSFLGTELYVTIHYSSLFVIGALIAKYKENVKSFASSLSKKTELFLFLVGIILYLYAHPSFVLNMVIQDFNPYYRVVIDTWFTAIGAGIFIMFSISSSVFSKVLRNRLVNYLGKISYSLYLSHLIVLFSSVHLLNKILPIWIICLISVIGTLIVSSIVYYLVEKPSIKLGKYLTSNTRHDISNHKVNKSIKIS